MARHPRLLFGSAIVCLLAGCGGGSGTAARTLTQDESKLLLLNRNWLDRVPRKADDKLKVYRFVPAMGGGVFQDRTIFFGTFELFTFDADGARIRFNLLHTGERRESKYAIEALRTPGPEGVDLQLTIADDPRGPKRYFGWSKEGADLDAQLRSLVSAR